MHTFRAATPALSLLLLLAGCPETETHPLPDAGATDAGRDGGGADAGLDAGSADGGPDAGPCGGPCPATTPICRDSDGACVECLGNDDCTDVGASLCDTGGMCQSCTADVDCGHLAATPRCVTDACVACTPAMEATDCGADSCDPSTNACSGIARGSRRTCEACVSDSDCTSPDLCAPMQYGGADRDGGYCLRPVSSGCEQPFSVSIAARASLSGATAMDFCGIDETRASCEAVRGLLDNAMCPGGTDAECPGPGGLCRTVGVLSNRCTYECAGASECKLSGAGSTCGRAGGSSSDPQYCGG